MADDDDAAVLSDVDDADSGDPSPLVLPSAPCEQPHDQSERLLHLTAELDEERRLRRAAEDARAEADARLSRLKAFAQEVIRKRDDLSRAAEDAARAHDEASRARDDAVRDLAAVRAQLDALTAEVSTASSMLFSGLDKISGKVSSYRHFEPGLPKAQKYSNGLPSVAYGVVKRANEITEELLKQIEAAATSRDRAREQMEQRNYEIAIEVSELEATVSTKTAECETFVKSLAERDARIGAMEGEILELRKIGEELDGKVKFLEGKQDAQRPVLVEQLSYVSKAYEKMHEILKSVDSDAADAVSDSSFIGTEADVEENLKVSLEGTKMVYELAATAAEKVGARMEESSGEVRALTERVEELLGEKQHIGVLLRSALLANTNEVLQVAEDGLREAGIEVGLGGHSKRVLEGGEHDEVYTLAGALENTVKESQVKIIELQHLVEALRAESGLLRGRLEGQEKEISQLRKQIKHLEEKERMANESVEGLMMDVTAAEEEIKRWKMAAEEEAEAGRAIEQEFQTQITSLRKELDEAKQAMLELENKLKFKEETAAAAMAARDAAEKSLKLADMRSSRLRERLEELNRQLEESDNRNDLLNSNSHRYVCWPWQWLGLNFVRLPPAETDLTSNEMELSEPLI